MAKSDLSTPNQKDISPQEQPPQIEGEIVTSPYGQLQTRSIIKEMETSYLDYAMSVIVARALPDARDGMKPVHRRILYSMHRSGIHAHTPYKKCARIVGDVLGKYHPHGDSSVYMALVRLAQSFSMRYALIDGQGNFGSIDGDSPAAMRYTEARMSKISAEILADIDKDSVPMTDNFDGSLKEPTVLPGKIPNLLLMGSEGIAVGMATKIPPHNLTEVCQAIIATIQQGTIQNTQVIDTTNITKPTDKNSLAANQALIDQAISSDPRQISGNFTSAITFEEIMSHIKGPDFPTAGIIFDKKSINEAYQTGKGRVIIRAKAEITEEKGKFQIVATQLPYQVNKAKLLEKIAELTKAKKLIGIKEINDYSDRKGMTIAIDLKKDAQPKVVLNKLYKLTEFQISFPINMVALNSEGIPQLMNIKQILREYILHRQLVIIRRAQFDLIKARDRAHILEGLIIALDNLDAVIKTIRESYDDAREKLMSRFGLSEIQAQAILDMQLKRLQGLEREKIEEEYNQIQKTINQLLKLLGTPQQVLDTITQEVQELIEKYGDKRLTTLVKSKVGEFNEEDLIADQETIITLTRTGYIKRLSPDVFRAQSRGGKGFNGVKMKAEDVVKCILSVNTHDSLLLFTNFGRVFKIKAYEIPESSRTAKGSAVVNIVNLKPEEKVESILPFDLNKNANNFIALITKNGLVKKTAVKQFDNIRSGGIIAIVLHANDQLVWGQITTGKDDILLVTHTGKSIRFSETQVKATSRDTRGVKGIMLQKDDHVVDVEVIKAIDKNKKQFLLTITQNGMGKMTAIAQYPHQSRAGMGLKVAIVNEKTGPIVKAFLVNDLHEDLIISSSEGQTLKTSLGSIPALARVSQGVILIRLTPNDRVVTATLTAKTTVNSCS
jgi:DNA gyrase subunit A